MAHQPEFLILATLFALVTCVLLAVGLTTTSCVTASLAVLCLVGSLVFETRWRRRS